MEEAPTAKRSKNNIRYRNWSSEAGSSPSSSASPPAAPRPIKPAELIERYVAQGMDKEAASEKVIEELHAALQRSMYPMQRFLSLEKTFRSSASKLEESAKRFAVIEAKLDSKPELPQVFVAGVAAGVFLHAATKAAPVIFGAFHDVLGNIKRAFQR